VLSATAYPVQASDRPAKPRKPGGQDALFTLLDTNHDGFLNLAELRDAEAVLRKLDKNGDGNLTQEELMPARKGKGANGKKGAENKPRK
jgi:Ca2+-binding EF-hand superfamily protein